MTKLCQSSRQNTSQQTRSLISHLGNLRTVKSGVILNSVKAQGHRPEDRPVTLTAYQAWGPRWAERHCVHLRELTPSWEERAHQPVLTAQAWDHSPRLPRGRPSFHKDFHGPSPACTWCHLNR